MPKEWILNSATNRFQLNFKRNVGAVSEADGVDTIAIIDRLLETVKAKG